jgi:hypothetical protein
MIARIMGDRRAQALGRRIDRPEAIGLAIVQAAIATMGWLVTEPVYVAVAVALQLAVGGLGAVRVIGPAHGGGLARYAMPATAGVAATLFGRLLSGGVALLLVPLVVVLLWSVLYVEVRGARLGGVRTIGELLLTAVLFCASSGVFALLGPDATLPALGLVAATAAVVSMRSAEARGLSGAEAVGQALLHLLAVLQVSLGVTLLDLPGVVGPAVIGLAFYAWGGAAEALGGGASGRSVAIEFGALAALGLAVALLLQGF